MLPKFNWCPKDTSKVTNEEREKAISYAFKRKCKVRIESRVGILSQEVSELLTFNSIELKDPKTNLRVFNQLCYLYRVQYFIIPHSKNRIKPELPVIQIPDFPLLYTRWELEKFQSSDKKAEISESLSSINESIQIRIFPRSYSLVMKSRHVRFHIAQRKEVSLWFSVSMMDDFCGKYFTVIPIYESDILNSINTLVLTYNPSVERLRSYYYNMMRKRINYHVEIINNIHLYFRELKRVLKFGVIKWEKAREIIEKIEVIEAREDFENNRSLIRKSLYDESEYLPDLAPMQIKLFDYYVKGGFKNNIYTEDTPWFEKEKKKRLLELNAIISKFVLFLPQDLITFTTDFLYPDYSQQLPKDLVEQGELLGNIFS
jgi:hypothetical protein